VSSRRPTFIVRNNNHSAYFFRSIIPKDLRKQFNGTREIRISLKTGIRSEARKLSLILKFQLDIFFDEVRCGNNSATCVSSLKRHLKNYFHQQILTENRGSTGLLGIHSGIDPYGRHLSPPPSPKNMKLSPQRKIVRDYTAKLTYAEIIKVCLSENLEFGQDEFPRRYISKSRKNFIKLLELNDQLDDFAEEIAKKVVLNHLLVLNKDGVDDFLSDYPEAYREVLIQKKDGQNPTLDCIIEYLSLETDLSQIAIDLGIGSLFDKSDDKPSEGFEGDNELDEVDSDSSLNTSVPNKTLTSEKLISESGKKKKTGPSISSVLDEYLEEMSAAKAWADKTKLEIKTAVEKLIEIIGDSQMESLSFELARKYKKSLVKLPANMKKDKRYRDKSIEEILLEDKKKPDDLKLKPISINTANNSIAKVIAFMNWARQNGYVVENYFSGMKLKNKKQARDERKPFSEADIKKVFNPKTYLIETSLGPARYWVPLLGLFSGARLNELCQIHVKDVINSDGISCLDINANKDDPKNPKKIKNKASQRVIPIHPQLIELGFLDYVEQQRKKKSVRLFPELSLSIDGYSRKVGRWFNEQFLRKKLGIKEKTFHSFRHSLTDSLKQKGVGESYLSEYLGHTTGESITYGRYAKQYQPKVLMDEVVKRIEYNLNHQRLMKN
jgi:integrase